MKTFWFSCLLVCFASFAPLAAQEDTQSDEAWAKFIVKSQVAYDPIDGAVLFGGGLGYRLDFDDTTGWGFDLDALAGSSEDKYTEGSWDYDEKKSLFFLAAGTEFLFGYRPEKAGPFFSTGTGFFVTSVSGNIHETLHSTGGNPNDEPIDYTLGGWFAKAAIGFCFGDFPLELRFQVPVLLTFSDPLGVSIPLDLQVAFKF